jgi:hypothetical protein
VAQQDFLGASNTDRGKARVKLKHTRRAPLGRPIENVGLFIPDKQPIMPAAADPPIATKGQFKGANPKLCSNIWTISIAGAV